MTRLGVYASATHVLLVLEHRAVVLFTARRALNPELSLESSLGELFVEARRHRPRVRDVHIVLGPGLAQLKRLERLPPLKDERLVRELVTALPERHFAMAGGVVLSNPALIAGHWWIGAADRKALMAVTTAAARHGIRVRSVRPIAALLADQARQSANGDELTFSDDGIALRVRCENAQLVESTRLPGVTPIAYAAPVQDASLAIAGRASRTTGHPPFSFHLAIESRAGYVRRYGRAISIMILVCSVVGAALGPGLSARAERRHAERAMELLRAEVRVVAKEQYALTRDATTLNRLRTFAATRRLVSPLLAALSVQLPESTAIVSFRLDTLGGSLVAVSSTGADLVTAVAATEGVRDAQLSAPITRETMGSAELQRVGLRFWFNTPRRNQEAKRK